MTNPNNAIGTPAAYGGRSSIKGFNALTQVFTRGVVSGFKATAGTGLNLNLGGTANVPDIAIAENNEGLRTTIINRGSSAVALSLGTAPSTNRVVKAVVAYVESSAPSTSAEIDNQSVCGIIVVTGTESNNPQMPNDATIRSAITADGGNGATAYYVIVASVILTAGSGSISAITQGTMSQATLQAPSGSQDRTTTKVVGTATSTNYTNNGTGFTVATSGMYFISIIATTSISASDFILAVKLTMTDIDDVTVAATSTANYAGNKSATLNLSQMYWLNEGDVIQPQTKTDNASVQVSTAMYITKAA